MNIFWFRRDLRLNDNHGLFKALLDDITLPVFIFDKKILSELESDDARVTFIYQTLKRLNSNLFEFGSGIRIYFGYPDEIFKEIIAEFKPKKIFTNNDYEPYAIKRDIEITEICKEHNIEFNSFKDQVIFEKDEILKSDGTPFQVFTPYKNKWLSEFTEPISFPSEKKLNNLYKFENDFPELREMGFESSKIKVEEFNFNGLEDYEKHRDFPYLDKTSYASVHLRFGTLSVREAVNSALKINTTLLSELIWREFFMQILFHFPNVEHESFREKFRNIEWLNDEADFEKWKTGTTGYPIVDAGMRQLNATGYMHNRVRMIVASFLTKHLLIDWRWGERYFAEKLLDYDLSANNGNWQWAAGTGCDAAPYFRVFNPTAQQEKFDKNSEYINKWIPEFKSGNYPMPMVEHSFARKRALDVYSRY